MTETADQQALGEAKRLLRHTIRRHRSVRPESRRSADDAARTQVVKDALIAGSRPDTVALYLSVAPEPSTLELAAWLASVQVRVLLPVLTTHLVDGRLGEPDWAPYAGPDALREGPFGLLEPASEPVGATALRDAAIVVVPALAASRTGDRLGRGGGWYDRALLHAGSQARAWALLNDDEVLEVVPAQPWDVPVHAVATPSRLLDCG